MYQCYHRHSSYSNIIVPDSTVSNEDYAKRAIELGHGIISGVEHSHQGRYIEDFVHKYLPDARVKTVGDYQQIDRIVIIET